MEAPEFRDFAKEMVDYIANYLENIRDRWVANQYFSGKSQPPDSG